MPDTISEKPALDPRVLKQALDEIRAELRSRMGNKLSGPRAEPDAQPAEVAIAIPVDPAGTEGMTEGQPNDEGADDAPILSAPTDASPTEAGPTTQMIAALDEKKKKADKPSFYSQVMDTAAKRMLKAKI